MIPNTTPIYLGGPRLRAFFSITTRWSLTEQEQLKLLGITSPSTLKCWESQAQNRATVRLRHDTAERIGQMVGIYKAINILLPGPWPR